MDLYEAFVKVNGHFTKVQIHANSPYDAMNRLKALYGNCNGASRVG